MELHDAVHGAFKRHAHQSLSVGLGEVSMGKKSFTRRIEDFVCEHCRKEVKGDGYTNHCPHCLWSKHVDVRPGDRAATCGGMMEPITVEGTTDEYRLVHHCTRCGHEHRNITASDDSNEALIAIAKRRQAGNNRR